MIRFTDSPYEQMMQEIPPGRERLGASPIRRPGHPCHGCPYGRDAPCLGVCFRKLMRKRSDANEISGK